MKLFTPTENRRLNEAAGIVFLLVGLYLLLSFSTFNAADPSWDTIADTRTVENLGGKVGAWLADIMLRVFGFSAFLLPLFAFILGWKWVRSTAVTAPRVRLFGAALLVVSVCTAAAMIPQWRI